MTEGIWIAGTRSFAAEALGYAREAGLTVVGLLEPREREKVGTRVHGLPVEWLDDARGGSAVIGTGDADRRDVAERVAAAGFTAVTIVHPAAHVPETVQVGDGSIVAPGAVVGTHTVVGPEVVLGRGALVGHHTRIGELATLAPGANVAGNCEIGEGAFLGMGALVRDHVRIGAGATVAMGAVVVGDVPAGATVRGVPAR